MFLYFDKNLTLKTKIDHGERPRQGSDLNITVCLDADFWTNPDNIKIWGVNGADLWIIKLVLTVPDKTQSVDYFTSDKGELRVFEKLYESEIVYDLVPGTSYYMYDFHFSAKEATQKFGKLTANLYFVRDITTDDYVKLASAYQWEHNYSSVILKANEVGISYGSEYKKMVGNGETTVSNLTKTPIAYGKNEPTSLTDTSSGYYYEIDQQSVWIYGNVEYYDSITKSTQTISQWIRALQFNPNTDVLVKNDETKAFGSAEITVEKTVGYAQKVIDQLISIKYEDIMREFTKVYAAINVAGTRPDWAEINNTSPAFILNKPDLNKMSAEIESKLIQTALISPENTYIVWKGDHFPSLELPTVKGFKAQAGFKIDFGDGEYKEFDTASADVVTHTYTDGVDYHLISVNDLYVNMFKNDPAVMGVYIGNTVKTMPNGRFSIPNGIFSGCEDLQTANISDNVKEVGEYAFFDAMRLKNIQFGKNIETIKKCAFSQCHSLKKVIIPDKVKEIDQEAFANILYLKEVQFGEKVESVAIKAFAACYRLTNVKLGKSIKNIGASAFLKTIGAPPFGDHSSTIYTIEVEATTPPTLGDNAFELSYVDKIFVPESAYEAYKTAWSAYADKIVYKIDNSHLTSKVDKLNSDSTNLTENSDVKVYAQNTDKEGYANASESNKAHTIVKRGANKEIKIGDAMQADEATSLGQLNTAKDDLNNNIAIDPNKTYVLFVGKTINISCGSSFSNYQIDMGDGTVYPKDTTVDGTLIEHIYAKDRAHLIAVSGTAPNDTFDLAFSGTGNLYRVIQFADGIKKIGDVIGDTAVRVCVLPETLEEITAENAFANAKVVYCPAANPPTIATGVFADSEKIFVKTTANTQYIEAWQSLSEKIVSEVDSSDLEDLKGIGTRLIQHISNINNPHKVTKEQVGLDKVDNTSDLDKPISKATQAALDQKIGAGGGAIVGDMTIQGNLTVRGTATYENVQSLNVKDAIIVTNIDGEPLNAALSGLAIKKNSSKVYGLMYDPTDDTVKFGEGVLDAENKHFTFSSEYEGKPIATRADSKDLVEAHIIKWDSYINAFVDSGVKVSDLAKSSVFDLKHSKIQNTDLNGNKEDSWGTEEANTDLTIYSKSFYLKDGEQTEKYTGVTVGDGYVNITHSGSAGNAKFAMLENEFLITSSDANGKTATVEITPDGATIDNYDVMTSKGGTFIARPKVQENGEAVSVALIKDIANFLAKQSVGDNYSCVITNENGAFKIEITQSGEQSATHSFGVSKDGVMVDNENIPTAGKLNKLLAQIDENIIINPDKTYLLFGGTTFAAPQVAYDIDFGDGTIYDKQSAINHTYTDGFDYHIITISTGSATTFSLGANSTTLGSDASFRVVHFAEGLTNIQTFGENVKTEVAIFPSTVTAIGSNVLNKVDLVYINADLPPTRGSASIEEAKKIFVKRTANTIYKNAQDWLLLANNIVHEIDSSDIIGAGLSDEDIARSVTLSNPSTATNGTLTELELSTLLASNLNFIIFNNEIYYLADKGHTEGIVSYTHNGWNGAAIQNKSINITLSTREWSLVTGSTDIKAFIHNIYIKGTDDGGNTVCEIRLKRLSAGATKITSIAGLASLIDNNQVVEASGYKLVNGNYLSIPWIKNNSLYTVPATSAVGNPAWYNFTSMTCEVEDTVDMFNFAK